MTVYCERHYGAVEAGPRGGCKWCEQDRDYSVANAATSADLAQAIEHRDFVLRYCWPPMHLQPVHRSWWSRAWHYLTDWFTGES